MNERLPPRAYRGTLAPSAEDRKRVLRYMIAMFEYELALLEEYGDPGPLDGRGDRLHWKHVMAEVGGRG